MARDPASRFANAQEFQAALSQWASGYGPQLVASLAVNPTAPAGIPAGVPGGYGNAPPGYGSVSQGVNTNTPGVGLNTGHARYVVTIRQLLRHERAQEKSRRSVRGARRRRAGRDGRWRLRGARA